MQDKINNGLQLLNKLPQKTLSILLQVLIGIYIVWVCAQMTWKLFPQPVPASPILSAVSLSQANQSSQVDVSRISRLNLFGDYNAAPKQVVVQQAPEDAPETKLNLKLTGVVPSSIPALAAAIIEKSGSQDVYGIDEKIEGTRAVIKEIFADRVILEQSGRRETLMLEGRDYEAEVSTTQNNRNRNIAVDTPVGSVDVKEQQAVLQGDSKIAIEKLRKDAFSDPGKLIDYVKVNPLKNPQTNELRGYRLYPGKDPKLFQSVGLRAGDIAVEINGYDLTDFSQAIQAMNEIKTAQEASLLIDRSGEMTQIFLSLY